MGQLVEVALEIDVALKEQAEKVFAENGLTLEQATIAGVLPSTAENCSGRSAPAIPRGSEQKHFHTASPQRAAV